MSYKRNQVEWALWRHFALGAVKGKSAPRVFGTRIKRLLELDRSTDVYAGSEAPQARFAFVDEEPEGKGTDTAYSQFNVFCLALALDLLDAGFKQSEIIFLLRHVRNRLEREFKQAVKRPPDPRQPEAAEDRPECASYEDGGRRWADCRRFMVFSKIEATEVFGGKATKTPFIIAPVWCRGIEALTKELHRMNTGYRKAIVLELAHSAAAVTRLLDEAPVVRRGRR